jgi:hypothetical protein
LKETKGLLTWTPSDLAKSLKISLAEAKQVLAALEIQGYIKQHGTGEWLTTLAGETVSGAKTPRFTPESIEEALAALRSRIKLVNQDPKAPYKITDAAASERPSKGTGGGRRHSTRPSKIGRRRTFQERANGSIGFPETASRENPDAEYCALPRMDGRQNSSVAALAAKLSWGVAEIIGCCHASSGGIHCTT